MINIKYPSFLKEDSKLVTSIIDFYGKIGDIKAMESVFKRALAGFPRFSFFCGSACGEYNLYGPRALSSPCKSV